ncbi:hypothetical protein CsSME_00019256 [Camellia sinensis var. sinensis]
MCTMHDCSSSNKLEKQGGSHGNSLENETVGVDGVDGVEMNDVAPVNDMARLLRNEVAMARVNAKENEKNGSNSSFVGKTVSHCLGNIRVSKECKAQTVEEIPFNNQRSNDVRESARMEKVTTSGFMKSLSGKGCEEPGINIEILLGRA